MRRADSSGKPLMQGKIEGGRRSGQQRMRWLDGITNSMDMSFEQTPGDGEGQGSLVHGSPRGCKESDTTWRLNNNKVGWGWFGDDSSTLHLLCILFLLLSHQPHLRSSGIRAQRSGTPALMYHQPRFALEETKVQGDCTTFKGHTAPDGRARVPGPGCPTACPCLPPVPQVTVDPAAGPLPAAASTPVPGPGVPWGMSRPSQIVDSTEHSRVGSRRELDCSLRGGLMSLLSGSAFIFHP